MDENKQQTVEQSKGLTFRDILFILRKHWIAIVCFVAACTAAGFIWAKVERPVYQSTGTMLVSYESNNSTMTQDYTFSNYITNTYVSVIKEDLVMNKVSEKTSIPVSTLKSNTSVSSSSLIIKVTYSSSNKEQAQEVAKVIIDTAQEVANTTVNEDGVEKPVYHLLYDNLKVFSDPTPGKKVSHTLRNTAIGLGAGVALAFIYVVLSEVLNNKFKSSEEIERMLNLPILAGIPDYHFDDEKKGGK